MAEARVDFHTHTPASTDFRGTGSVTDVVQAASRAGIDILVLTDHNSIDGYLQIADRLDEFDPMLVLPGIEVTCQGGSEGLHVLGIMDPGRLGKRPRWLLKAVGLVTEERHASGLSDFDAPAVSAAIRARGGLVVAAHAASSKGVLKALRGRQLERVIGQCAFDAIELSTPAQRRAGAERLAQLGVLGTTTIVSGSDNHRTSSTPGGERPAGPGTRPVVLSIDPPWSFEKLKTALESAAGNLVWDLRAQTALERFQGGSDLSVVAVWRAQDRQAVVRAVAAMATLGHGTVLVGVRRGGRGGRGIVLASNAPSESQVEWWVWEDVRPTPSLEVRRREVGEHSFLEVELLAEANPFSYAVDGVPLTRRGGRVRPARIDTADHAEILRGVRAAITKDLLDQIYLDRPDALGEEQLIELFPWRGALTEEELQRVMLMVAYRLSKGSDSGVLRAWAHLASSDFRNAAFGLVRSLSRSFSISEAKRGVRSKLEEIGASRTLRRRVAGAFDGLVGSADALNMADQAFDSETLRRACSRLGRALPNQDLEGELLDVSFDETRRTAELLGTLITDDKVSVVVEAVVGEMGGDAGDQIRSALIASQSPISVVSAERAAEFAGTDIVLVSSDGSEVLASAANLIAIHAPVRGIEDLLETHRHIAQYAGGHFIARDELLEVLKARDDIDPSAETRALLFRSGVQAGLPAWWAIPDDLYSSNLPIIRDGLVGLIASTRDSTELDRLLRTLALLPGNHIEIAVEAATRSRAQVVKDHAALHQRPWELRVRNLLPARRGIEEIGSDEVLYAGEVVEVDHQPIVNLIRDGTLTVVSVDRTAAEACARQLKYVVSETLFDLLTRGVRERWRTTTALRSCDEATYMPVAIWQLLED